METMKILLLQGRYNTDIIQKDRQIWLRVGKFKEGKPNNEFNSKDVWGIYN